MGAGPEEAEGAGRGVSVGGATGGGVQVRLGAGQGGCRPPEPPGGRPRDRSLWDPSPQSHQEADSMTAACGTRPELDPNDQMISALLFSPSAWPAQQGTPAEFNNRP